jgi:hypothetical protein
LPKSAACVKRDPSALRGICIPVKIPTFMEMTMPPDALLDPLRPDLTLGVVGTGIMGRGIAQIAAQAGVRVLLYDTRAEAAPATGLHCGVREAGRKQAGAVPQARGGQREVADALPALSGCHLVIKPSSKT